MKNNFYITTPIYYVNDIPHLGHAYTSFVADTISRYKRLEGFNVLHPMGFDSFGLPAEQYAIKTGQHPNRLQKKIFKGLRNN